MYPLIHLGPITLGTYGLMICLGVALAALALLPICRRLGQSTQDALFMAVYALVAAAVGSKLLYLFTVLPQLPDYTGEQWAGLLSGGWVFYGGLLGAVGGAVLYCRQFHLDTLALVEPVVVVLPLGHAIGRVGCFMAGCCYGCPCPPPWGITLQNSFIAPNDIPLFPVQLAEAAALLLLFAGLVLFTRRHSHPQRTLGLYVTIYAMARFFLEMLRYDADRGVWLGLSTSQWISLALIPLGIALLCRGESGFLRKKLNFADWAPKKNQ